MKELNEQFYKDLKKEIMPYFEVNDDLHGFSHSQRVFNNAQKIISNGIPVDINIIKLSALLHDIANPMEMRGEIKCHAEEGSKIARKILERKYVKKDLINQVCYSISVHRVSKGLKPETIEAKVLQDADRLDALGAIIIARCFDYSSQKNRPYFVPGIPIRDFYDGSQSASTIHHMQEKILKLTPDKFHTKKAQEIAKGRYNYVKEFVNRFIKEWEGEL